MFCCTPGAENQEGADFGGMEVERIPVRIACAMGITIVAAVVAAVSRLTLLTLRLMKCALCSAANSLGTPKPPAQAQAPTQHDTPPTPYFPGISPLRFPGTGIIEYVFISRFLSFLDYFSSAFSLFWISRATEERKAAIDWGIEKIENETHDWGAAIGGWSINAFGSWLWTIMIIEVEWKIQQKRVKKHQKQTQRLEKYENFHTPMQNVVGGKTKEIASEVDQNWYVTEL